MFRVLHRTALGRKRLGNQPGPSRLPPRRQAQPLGLFFHQEFYQRRTFANVPAPLLAPLVFGGLLITLWTWKCFMMVIFQNKIIYMPGLPPNARKEKIEDYANQCGGIEWREQRTRASDGTQISLCVASVYSGSNLPQTPGHVYILYFQGNASSLPPRLPFLSPVLRLLRDRNPVSNRPVKYTMVCCSYRGYWTSGGRPSEKGIAKDAAAALSWIKADHDCQSSIAKADCKIHVVLWGQSIGAGVATNLAGQPEIFSETVALKTLILETPFLSVRAMLETLYPQKWLPYRYLWPFLWNHLDSWQALETLAHSGSAPGVKLPDVLILEAGKDELVPKSHAEALQRRCSFLGISVRKQVISGALHTEIMVRPEGRLAAVEAIEKASSCVS